MFKKIEIWILYLVLFLFLPFGTIFGVLVRQELVGKVKLGRISKTALFFADIPANIKRALIDDLEIKKDSFPYLSGFDGTPNKYESYLLFAKFDGDLREGIVELIDLTNFKVLHTWNPDINKDNQLIEKSNDFKNLNIQDHDARSILHHPLLLDDGDLVFIAATLRKIDACSNLIFQVTHDKLHHSIEKDIDGNLWVPSYMYPQSIEIKNIDRMPSDQGGYFDDGIVKLSQKGEILFEKSVSEILIDNGMEYLIYVNSSNDPIHLNDIQPVDFDGEFWKKGDVFLSLRNQSMVLLYRPSTNKIIWKGTGPFFWQHDVDILDDRKISVFNNKIKGGIVDGNNELIIYDFEKNEYSKYLSQSLSEKSIKTISQGLNQILPNDDLFIQESNYGRTLYFNADGSLRWEHLNRAENGKTYHIGWSRILYTKDDILKVEDLLRKKIACND